MNRHPMHAQLLIEIHIHTLSYSWLYVAPIRRKLAKKSKERLINGHFIAFVHLFIHSFLIE